MKSNKNQSETKNKIVSHSSYLATDSQFPFVCMVRIAVCELYGFNDPVATELQVATLSN
jgi:hypothetical protein